MPEGPEVKYITKKILSPHIGSTLTQTHIISGRYRKTKPKGYVAFTRSLPTKITDIKCKGKFIYFELQNGWYILTTLGLTGTFFNTCEGKARDERGILVDKYCRIRFTTSAKPFFYSDMRNFGTFTFTKDATKLNSKLKQLGPDPLQAETPKEVNEQIKHFEISISKQRNQEQPIGETLLNQRILSGVGNYIRAIALYNARISPFRPIQSLTKHDLISIYKQTHKLMLASYNRQLISGLHTFPLYIYRKTVSPKGHPIRSDVLPKGRHIYWSPKEQS